MAVVNIGDAVFWMSLAGLFILTLWGFARARNIGQTLFYTLLLLICGGAYVAFFQSSSLISPKGDNPPQWAFIAVLYICMILGMASNYFYNRFANPKADRPPFDWGSLFFPVFASPIVFVPLLVAFQNADVELAKLTTPKLMLFLVAFQNGFFWKEVIANQRKKRRA